MVVFLGYYAAAELSHFVEIVPRVLVSAVKWKKFGKKGFKISIAISSFLPRTPCCFKAAHFSFFRTILEYFYAQNEIFFGL